MNTPTIRPQTTQFDAEPQSRFDSKFHPLKESLGKLEEGIRMLADRLNPVLQPPCEDKKAGENVKGFPCALDARLDAINEKIGSNIELLLSIHERLCL